MSLARVAVLTCLIVAALAAAAVLELVWSSGSTPSNSADRPNRKDVISRAASLIDQKQYTAARRLLDSVLQEDPAHGMALLYRGQLFRDQGDNAAALADWRLVSNHEPRIEGTARFLEGSVLLDMHQARRSEQMLRLSAELHPNYLQPRERLLELHVAQMRRTEILTDLTGIERLRALTLEELVLRAAADERIRPISEGIALMRDFVAADPDDIESSVALARYLMEADRHGEAANLLRPLLREHPHHDQVRGLLSEALLNQQDFDGAWSLLKDVQVDQHVGPWLCRAIGRYAVAVEDWPLAARSFAEVATANPDDVSARYAFGSALRRVGDRDQAEEQLRTAELLDRVRRQAFRIPRGNRDRLDLLVPIMLDVGSTLQELGRDGEALAWFRHAAMLDSGNLDVYSALARFDAAGASGALPGNSIARHHDREPSISVHLNDARPSVPRSRDRQAPSSPSSDPIRLRDIHAKVGLDFQYFNGQTGLKYLVESMGAGVAVLDFDLDGWPDVYLPQGCPLPFDPSHRSHRDVLYRNRAGRDFVEATTGAGVHDYRYGQGCAAGDYDNDGFSDLVVANFGRNTFFRNNGDGTFSDITEQLGLVDEKWSSSIAFADLDRDGNLDLYIANYVDSLKVCREMTGKVSTCDPQNFGAEQDALYWNRSNGTFADITSTSGIVAPDGKGLGIIVADLDDDSWPDIYVANDGTPNFLFRNLGEPGPPRFEEMGLISGTALSGEGRAQAGMGIACADLDGDERLDLHVTNFYLETNALYLNQGNMLFVDDTRAAGLAEPSNALLGFGTQAVDLNLDGTQELFVANGHIDDFEFRGEPWRMPPQLFQNVGGARFDDVSKETGDYFHGKYLGRGVARWDWNRDGRPDLIVAHQDRPVALLNNETNIPPGVVLEFHGTESNRDATGTRIRVFAGGKTQVLEICGGDGFFSTNEKRQFVGTGAAGTVERLEIRWPSGRTEIFSKVPGSGFLVVREGSEPLQSPLRPH